MKQFFTILACICLFIGGFCLGIALNPEGYKHETVYDTLTVIDTVPYYHPVPRDSTVIRYVTVTLPAAHDTGTADCVPREAACDTLSSDSVRAQVPITQKVYSTSDYTAYVSGYRASLDSIDIYRMQYSLEPRPPDKSSRWGLSAGTGVAWTPEGLKPALFVGISYTFKRF